MATGNSAEWDAWTRFGLWGWPSSQNNATFTVQCLVKVLAGSPSRGGDVIVHVLHKPTELAHFFFYIFFILCYCVYFCLRGLFNSI